MSAFPHRLRWVEIDPATHPFDPASLQMIVHRALAPYSLQGDERKNDRELAEDAVTRELVVEYGTWAMCWNWSAGDDGGPVRRWCCPSHDLDTDNTTARKRVVEAVLEWRGILERLHAEFATLHRECEGLTDEEAAMRGAARLLPLVLEWTDCQDAWRGTFSTFLAWFLEPRLKDSERTGRVIINATKGWFESWEAPSAEKQAKAIQAIGQHIHADAAGPETSIDALAEWQDTRRWTTWITTSSAPRHLDARDGHLAFIDSHDLARDPARAARMREALTLARETAVRREPLTFARMQSWQRIVLDTHQVEFRTGEAFAKQGRERYGLPPGGWNAFEDCLQQANADSPHAVARAARVYLDTCFFHPFPDGNARAARLALDFVLTRAGFALHSADPVFLLARLANDWPGAYSLQAVIESLVCPPPT